MLPYPITTLLVSHGVQGQRPLPEREVSSHSPFFFHVAPLQHEN